jgi:hypothetical protein
MLRLTSLRIALLLCGYGVCLGQSTALLNGSVSDPSGAAISGAQVKCSNTETDLRLSVLTNHEGIFRFPDLPVGPYELSISHEGFGTLIRNGITLFTGQTLDLNLTLAIGQASQSVQVSSQVALIQTATSELRTTVDSRQMADLPLKGAKHIRPRRTYAGIGQYGRGHGSGTSR